MIGKGGGLMNWRRITGTAAAAAAAGLAGAAIGRGRALARAARAYRHVLERPRASLPVFTFDLVEHLPEIAQRYFRHALRPGTPLFSRVELAMSGSFLLGQKGHLQTYEMVAREALSSDNQFVWLPEMRSGLVSISGSDGLADGQAWTRFWLAKLIPVATAASSRDLVRSAQFRAVGERALWLPTSMLPQHGVEWHQVGQNEARIVFTDVAPSIETILTLHPSGAVAATRGLRWSNANDAQRFRLQPFGGTILASATFQGVTISSEVAIGNHYGTPDFVPFFQARITGATYG